MLGEDARIGDIIDEAVDGSDVVKRIIITNIHDGRIDYIYSHSFIKEWKRSYSTAFDVAWERRTVLYNLKDIPELLCQI